MHQSEYENQKQTRKANIGSHKITPRRNQILQNYNVHNMRQIERSRDTTPQSLLLNTPIKSSRGTTHQQHKKVNLKN